MKLEKTFVLATFNNMLEATFMQDKWKVNGTDSFVQNENPIGLHPLGGVELKIFEKDKKTAAEINSAFALFLFQCAVYGMPIPYYFIYRLA